MKGRKAAKEVALTSDAEWRTLTGEGLRVFTWTRGVPCDNAAMLPEALDHAASRTTKEVCEALDPFDVRRVSRQGAVRLSESTVEKAEALCRRLNANLPPGSRTPSLRWIVLAALVLYSRHLRDQSTEQAAGPGGTPP